MRDVFDNPVIGRCSACEAKRYLWPGGRYGLVLYMSSWFVFCDLAVWRAGVSTLVGSLLVLAVALPYGTAVRRTYYAYWRWRHPLRCGGGHLKPAPEAS